MGCAHARRHLHRQRRPDRAGGRRRHRPGGRARARVARSPPSAGSSSDPDAGRRAGPGRRATGGPDHLARRRPDPARPTASDPVAPARARRPVHGDRQRRRRDGGRCGRRSSSRRRSRCHPPRGGGQLRCFHLYGALAPTRRRGDRLPGRPAAIRRARPTSRRAWCRPWSPAHRRHTTIGEELSERGGMPVTDIVAGDRHLGDARLPRRAAPGRRTGAIRRAPGRALPAAGGRAGRARPAVHLRRVQRRGRPQGRGASPTPASAASCSPRWSTSSGERSADRRPSTACSAEDADALAARYGRPRADISVIPNGTDTDRHRARPGRAARAAAARWRDRFAAERHRRPAAGAPRAVLRQLAPAEPRRRRGHPRARARAARRAVPPRRQPRRGVPRPSRPANVVFPGVVAERAKAALLGCVDVALNPMRTGSGTNLKVIEYLAAGVPVVSTPFGVRGLDVVDGDHLLRRPADGVRRARSGPTIDDPVGRASAGGGRTGPGRRALRLGRLGDRLWTMVRDDPRRPGTPHPAGLVTLVVSGWWAVTLDLFIVDDGGGLRGG